MKNALNMIKRVVFGLASAVVAMACSSGSPNETQASAPFEKPGRTIDEPPSDSFSDHGGTTTPSVPNGPGTGGGGGTGGGTGGGGGCDALCGSSFTCSIGSQTSDVTLSEKDGNSCTGGDLTFECGGTVRADGENVGSWTLAGNTLVVSVTTGNDSGTVTCTKK